MSTPKRSATLSRAVREGWVDGAVVSAMWHDAEYRARLEREVAHLAAVKERVALIGEQSARLKADMIWRLFGGQP